MNQRLLPAIRHLKDLERLLKMNYKYQVLLDTHIGHVGRIVDRGNALGKKMFVHADLIAGLKSDEYAAEFLAQQIRPAGIISTRKNVIRTARKNGLLTVQRVFLFDSISMETSLNAIKQTEPDFVEILPGVIPRIIRQIVDRVNVPVWAGGFIQSPDDVEEAWRAGVTSVTTSNIELWKKYEPE